MSVDAVHERGTVGAGLVARARTLSAASGPQLLLMLATAAMAWRSAALLIDQAHALVLPGAVVGALVALALVMLVNRSPARAGLPFDDETDVIVSFMFGVLGAWFLYWTPTRFGQQYWLWRPDLVALAMCGLALAALIGGAGLVLYIGPSVVLAAVFMSPLVGLVLHEHAPSLAAVAVLSAVGASAPLLVARPFKRRRFITCAALALAGAIVALAAGHVRHLSSGRVSLLAAALALVLVEGAILYSTRSGASPRGARGAPLASFRVWGAVFVAAGFGALDGLIPVFSSAQGNPISALLAPGPQRLGSLKSPGGVHTTGWKLAAGGPSHALGVEVFASTGPSAAAVLTYPVQGLVNWIGQLCPKPRTYRIAGQKVTTGEYANNQTGTSWDLYTWTWHTAQRYQQVTVVMGYGPQGAAPRMPKLTGDAGGTGVSTAGLLVANRHIVCFDGPAQRTAGRALTSQLIRSVS